MSKDVFLLFLISGAALLALWIAMRFPNQAPSSLTAAFLHIAVAMLVGVGVAPAMSFVAGGAGWFVAVLAVALPAFTYMFLAGMWLARAAVEAIPH